MKGKVESFMKRFIHASVPKRRLSFLLALALVVSLLPASPVVKAEGETEGSDSKNSCTVTVEGTVKNAEVSVAASTEASSGSEETDGGKAEQETTNEDEPASAGTISGTAIVTVTANANCYFTTADDVTLSTEKPSAAEPSTDEKTENASGVNEDNTSVSCAISPSAIEGAEVNVEDGVLSGENEENPTQYSTITFKVTGITTDTTLYISGSAKNADSGKCTVTYDALTNQNATLKVEKSSDGNNYTNFTSGSEVASSDKLKITITPAEYYTFADNTDTATGNEDGTDTTAAGNEDGTAAADSKAPVVKLGDKTITGEKNSSGAYVYNIDFSTDDFKNLTGEKKLSVEIAEGVIVKKQYKITLSDDAKTALTNAKVSAVFSTTLPASGTTGDTSADSITVEAGENCTAYLILTVNDSTGAGGENTETANNTGKASGTEADTSTTVITSATLTFSPETNVKQSGGQSEGGKSYIITISDISSDITINNITIGTAQGNIVVTIQKDDTEGNFSNAVIDPTSTRTESGGTVTFTVKPEENYTFNGEGATIPTVSAIDVKKDTTTEENGSGQAAGEENAAPVITDTHEGDTYTFTVKNITADCTIKVKAVAVAKPAEKKVTYKADQVTNATVKVQQGSGESYTDIAAGEETVIADGSSLKVIVTANEDYSFAKDTSVKVSIGGTELSGLEAVYDDNNSYTVDIASDKLTGLATDNANAITVTVTPALVAPYKISLSEDAKASLTTNKVTATFSSESIKANATDKSVTLTLVPTEKDAVIESATAKAGEVTYSGKAGDNGAYVIDIKNITADVVITSIDVKFKAVGGDDTEKEFTVTCPANNSLANAVIKVEKITGETLSDFTSSSKVKADDTLKVTVTAEDGYTITGLTVTATDGKTDDSTAAVTNNTSGTDENAGIYVYDITGFKADTTIKVSGTAQKKQYTVTVPDEVKKSVEQKNAKIELSAASVTADGKVTITISPAEGYTVKTVSVTVDKVNGAEPCTVSGAVDNNGAKVITLSGFKADVVIGSVTVETEKNTVTPAVYKLSYKENTGAFAHAIISLDKKELTNSEKALLTIKPESGYVFEGTSSILVTKTNDNCVVSDAIANDDGSYSFQISGLTADCVLLISAKAVLKAFTASYSGSVERADIKVYKVSEENAEENLTIFTSGSNIYATDKLKVVITPDDGCTFTTAPEVKAVNASVGLPVVANGEYSYIVHTFKGNTDISISGASVNKEFTVTLPDNVKSGVKENNATAEIDTYDVIAASVVKLIVTPDEQYKIVEGSVAATAAKAADGSATCTVSEAQKGANGTYVITITGFKADTVIESVTVKTEGVAIKENGTDTSVNIGEANLGNTEFNEIQEKLTEKVADAFNNTASSDIDNPAMTEEEKEEAAKAKEEAGKAVEALKNNEAYLELSLTVDEKDDADITPDEENARQEGTAEIEKILKQDNSKPSADVKVEVKPAMNLDISLFSVCKKKSDNTYIAKTSVTELDKESAVTISMKLPANLPSLKGDKREYYIICIHKNTDGTIEKTSIKCTDNKDGTISFPGEKFSTYVLCYADITVTTNKKGGLFIGGVTSTSTPVPTSTPETTSTPVPTSTPGQTPGVSASPAPAVSSVPSEAPGVTEPGNEPSAKPSVSAAPSNAPGNNNDTGNGDTSSKVKKGKKVTVKNGNYKVTSVSGTKTVQFTGAKKNAKNVVIPSSVKVNGKNYKVTTIAKNACKGNKKLTKVTVGANVKSIGKNAFKGCSNLKSIVIKTKKLTAKKVGSNAFKGINSKAKVKVPGGKVKAYKKIVKSKGAANSVKVTKQAL